MSEEHDQEGDALKVEQEAAFAATFAKLVDAAGGSTAAAKILKKARGTVEQWAAGRRRLPMAPAVALAMHVDKNLDRFAIGGDEVSRSLPSVPVFTDAGSVPDGFVVVPTFDVQASAGDGALAALDIESSELVAFRHTWLRSLGLIPGRVHILWALGDSMNPTIRDGDMLLIDRTIDRVVNDGIYVVVTGGAVRVKRIFMRQNGSVVLRSDNDRYPEEVVPADELPQLIVEGRVRWVGGVI